MESRQELDNCGLGAQNNGNASFEQKAEIHLICNVDIVFNASAEGKNHFQ